MIKKSVFEEEIIAGMHNQLVKQAKGIETDNLDQAVNYLNSAAQIFEDLGMLKNADEVLSILYKVGQHHHKDNGHTEGLTSEKMIENLKDHGTVFNMADDNLANQEIEDTLEVSDQGMELHDFEDEMADDTKPLGSTAADDFEKLLREQIKSLKR